MGKPISISVPSEKNDTTVMKRKKPSRRLTVVMAALIVVMVIVIAALFIKYHHATKSNPVTRQQELTRQLGQLIEMPPEQPVISTVLDKSKITNQPLAARAQNDDVIFIFPQSKRLILYRPSDKRVVDMLNISS